VARIVGLDFGRRRIGLARTDLGGMIASPWTVLSVEDKQEKRVEAVIKALSEIECDLIVVGLPLTMAGKDSEMTTMVREFAALLEEKSGIRIKLWDERLTSAQGDAMLREVGMKRKKRDQMSDTLAATLILQSYMDAHLV